MIRFGYTEPSTVIKFSLADLIAADQKKGKVCDSVRPSVCLSVDQCVCALGLLVECGGWFTDSDAVLCPQGLRNPSPTLSGSLAHPRSSCITLLLN